MLKRLATGIILGFVATPTLCDDPASTAPVGLPATVGEIAPSRFYLPALPADYILQTGMTSIRARQVKTMVSDGKQIVVLTGEPQIDHSSQYNGTFSISANTIRVQLPLDVMANPRTVPLHELNATGSCTFNAGPLRISSRQVLMRTDRDAGQSTLEFSGDVYFAINGITATADAISLTRNGDDWILSGVLAMPKADE
jgi:hypothetical protein